MKVIPKKYSTADEHILIAFRKIWKYIITKHKYKFKYRVRYLDLDEVKEAINIFDDIKQLACFPRNNDGTKRIENIIVDYYNYYKEFKDKYKPEILFDVYRVDVWDENIERKWDTELFEYLDRTIYGLEMYYGKIDTWERYMNNVMRERLK